MKRNNLLCGKKIGFIGVGNMGSALIKGILDAKIVAGKDLMLSDLLAEKLECFKKAGAKVNCNNREAAAGADILFLAVKPQNIDAVLSEIKGLVKKGALVISIAAGVQISKLENYLSENPVIRSMPNMPAVVKSGITAITAGRLAGDAHKNVAKELFGSVGDVIEVEEKMMNAVTALASSGSAYVYYFMECMVDAGIKLGFSEDIAKRLAFDTVKGAVNLFSTSGQSPETLRNMITSPGGTTDAAIKSLKAAGFMNIVVEAVKMAEKRAQELSK